jgi:hypothetical protein
MLDYDLTGKQVVLALEEEFLPHFKALGVRGSPLVARVLKAEESGLWLENPAFSVCPVGAKKIYDSQGEALCLAHVFIPARAVVTLAVFPHDVQNLEDNPELHQIGFKPEKTSAPQRHK